MHADITQFIDHVTGGKLIKQTSVTYLTQNICNLFLGKNSNNATYILVYAFHKVSVCGSL